MTEWQDTSWGDALVAVRRTYPDGTDVVLSIHRAHGEFEVRSSAESRTSGPVEVQHGRAATLDAAKRLLEAEKAAWDAEEMG
jgi:hypothetical protein